MSMTETKEVRIPPSGDPFTAVTSKDSAAAGEARTFREEMNTGPDPYADPARWIGASDADEDERRAG